MECKLSDVESDEGIISEGNRSPTLTKSLRSENLTKKQTREVMINTTDKNETIVITQKIKTKKKKNKSCTIRRVPKCNIELGREYYKEELEAMKVFAPKMTHRPKDTVKERIVPNCYRLDCDSKKKHHSRKRREKKKKRENSNNKYKSMRKKLQKKETSEVVEEHALSPISLSSINSENKKQCQISYEDVSSDSFTSHPECELDTLIKRTKEREKYMTISSEFLSEKPHRSSTPNSIILISSEDTQDSKGSASMHSQATIVLDRQVQDITYSPVTKHENEGASLKTLNLKPDTTESMVDTDSHLTYYHYYNVTNNNDFKTENNNIYN